MSTRSDYSADEWKAISTAPAAVALAITLSDAAGPFETACDPVVVARAITHSALAGVPEIVSVLAESLRNGTDPPDPREIGPGNCAQMKKALIGTVRAAVHAIERKSPTEVESFKAWLASVASRVCHATNPVANGMAFSREKQDTIDLMAAVLAVTFASVNSMEPNHCSSLGRSARPLRCIHLDPSSDGSRSFVR
ncbi:MAG TPA: hypothetical protein VH458_09770 [Vicinamibacterales bacterium]|jgi:hypothetical protein